MGYTFTGKAVDLGYGRGWMDEPAALSQFRIDAELGHPQQITEAGRTWDQQNVFWHMYLNGTGSIALNPDTPSVHQKGRAKDTNERLADVRFRHGWRLTVYRWVNGVYVLVEPWHEEYFQELDLYYGTTSTPANTGNSTDLSLEDFMSGSQYHYGVADNSGNHRGAAWFTPLGVFIPRLREDGYDEEAQVLARYYDGQVKQPRDIGTRDWDVLNRVHEDMVAQFQNAIVQKIVAEVKGPIEPPTTPVEPPVVVPGKA